MALALASWGPFIYYTPHKILTLIFSNNLTLQQFGTFKSFGQVLFPYLIEKKLPDCQYLLYIFLLTLVIIAGINQFWIHFYLNRGCSHARFFQIDLSKLKMTPGLVHVFKMSCLTNVERVIYSDFKQSK